jgi:hypothetical protein
VNVLAIGRLWHPPLSYFAIVESGEGSLDTVERKDLAKALDEIARRSRALAQVARTVLVCELFRAPVIAAS